MDPHLRVLLAQSDLRSYQQQRGSVRMFADFVEVLLQNVDLVLGQLQALRGVRSHRSRRGSGSRLTVGGLDGGRGRGGRNGGSTVLLAAPLDVERSGWRVFNEGGRSNRTVRTGPAHRTRQEEEEEEGQ